MAIGDSISQLAELTPQGCRGRAADGRRRALPDLGPSPDPTPTGPETINAEATSHQARQVLANRAQRTEITKHRAKMINETGRGVTLDEAARDWISHHAAAWRARFDANQRFEFTSEERPVAEAR